MNQPKRKFSFAEVAELARIPVATLRDWYNEKPGRPAQFVLDPKLDEPSVPGGTRYVSPHTTLAICIAAELTRLGLPISRAAFAAMSFAHTTLGDPSRKHPAALYGGYHQTVLSVGGIEEVKIFPIGRIVAAEDFLFRISEGATAFVLVDPIVERIEKAAKQ